MHRKQCDCIPCLKFNIVQCLCSKKMNQKKLKEKLHNEVNLHNLLNSEKSKNGAAENFYKYKDAHSYLQRTEKGVRGRNVTEDNNFEQREHANGLKEADRELDSSVHLDNLSNNEYTPRHSAARHSAARQGNMSCFTGSYVDKVEKVRAKMNCIVESESMEETSGDWSNVEDEAEENGVLSTPKAGEYQTEESIENEGDKFQEREEISDDFSNVEDEVEENSILCNSKAGESQSEEFIENEGDEFQESMKEISEVEENCVLCNPGECHSEEFIKNEGEGMEEICGNSENEVEENGASCHTKAGEYQSEETIENEGYEFQESMKKISGDISNVEDGAEENGVLCDPKAGENQSEEFIKNEGDEFKESKEEISGDFSNVEDGVEENGASCNSKTDEHHSEESIENEGDEFQEGIGDFSDETKENGGLCNPKSGKYQTEESIKNEGDEFQENMEEISGDFSNVEDEVEASCDSKASKFLSEESIKKKTDEFQGSMKEIFGDCSNVNDEAEENGVLCNANADEYRSEKTIENESYEFQDSMEESSGDLSSIEDEVDENSNPEAGEYRSEESIENEGDQFQESVEEISGDLSKVNNGVEENCVLCIAKAGEYGSEEAIENEGDEFQESMEKICGNYEDEVEENGASCHIQADEYQSEETIDEFQESMEKFSGDFSYVEDGGEENGVSKADSLIGEYQSRESLKNEANAFSESIEENSGCLSNVEDEAKENALTRENICRTVRMPHQDHVFSPAIQSFLSIAREKVMTALRVDAAMLNSACFSPANSLHFPNIALAHLMVVLLSDSIQHSTLLILSPTEMPMTSLNSFLLSNLLVQVSSGRKLDLCLSPNFHSLSSLHSDVFNTFSSIHNHHDLTSLPTSVTASFFLDDSRFRVDASLALLAKDRFRLQRQERVVQLHHLKLCTQYVEDKQHSNNLLSYVQLLHLTSNCAELYVFCIDERELSSCCTVKNFSSCLVESVLFPQLLLLSIAPFTGSFSLLKLWEVSACRVLDNRSVQEVQVVFVLSPCPLLPSDKEYSMFVSFPPLIHYTLLMCSLAWLTAYLSQTYDIKLKYSQLPSMLCLCHCTSLLAESVIECFFRNFCITFIGIQRQLACLFACLSFQICPIKWFGFCLFIKAWISPILQFQTWNGISILCCDCTATSTAEQPDFVDISGLAFCLSLSLPDERFEAGTTSLSGCVNSHLKVDEALSKGGPTDICSSVPIHFITDRPVSAINLHGLSTDDDHLIASLAKPNSVYPVPSAKVSTNSYQVAEALLPAHIHGPKVIASNLDNQILLFDVETQQSSGETFAPFRHGDKHQTNKSKRGNVRAFVDNFGELDPVSDQLNFDDAIELPEHIENDLDPPQQTLDSVQTFPSSSLSNNQLQHFISVTSQGIDGDIMLNSSLLEEDYQCGEASPYPMRRAHNVRNSSNSPYCHGAAFYMNFSDEPSIESTYHHQESSQPTELVPAQEQLVTGISPFSTDSVQEVEPPTNSQAVFINPNLNTSAYLRIRISYACSR